MSSTTSRVLRSRSARVATGTAVTLALLDIVIGLPWPVWVAWAGLTAWSLTEATRAVRRA